MDAMALDRWVPFRNEGAVVRCRLFAFPHAAGNAALYRPLRRLMPPEVDFCPVELPGRAARLDEPPLTSMSALTEQLRDALQPLMAVPFAFSATVWGRGWPMKLPDDYVGRRPASRHLFVSGRGGPCAVLPTLPRHVHGRTTICSPFCAVSAAHLSNHAAPRDDRGSAAGLGADLALVEGYAVDPGHRILVRSLHSAAPTTPIRAPSSPGEASPVEISDLHIPGGHFYFVPSAVALAREIVGDLHASVGIGGDGYRTTPS